MTTATETAVTTQTYRVWINAAPEAIWQALTDPEWIARYGYRTRVDFDLQPGGVYRANATEEMLAFGAPPVMVEGEVLEVDPPRRLVHTMAALWDDEVRAEGFSRVTWEIEQVGDSCHLTLTHDQLREGANAQIFGGWPMVLSGLKTWLETGELLTTPGSIMYA